MVIESDRARIAKVMQVNNETSNTPSKWKLRQEYILMSLLGGIPISPGCRLRRWAYRSIFARVGQGAYIEPGVQFNSPSQIWLGDRVNIFRDVRLDATGVNNQIQIGSSVMLDLGVSIIMGGSCPDCRIEIGDNTYIGPYTCITGPGTITIGKDCLIGAHTGIFANNHIFADPQQLIREQGVTRKGVLIEDDCWLGTKVSVLDGVTIGRGSVIGAGAVVTKNIPPYSVAVGVPAKVIAYRGEKALSK